MENKVVSLSLLCFLFFLGGCDSDPFPIKYVYLVDTKLQTCDRYVIYDVENIKFKFDKYIEYNECPISFGLTSYDTGKLMSWARRQKKMIESEK